MSTVRQTPTVSFGDALREARTAIERATLSIAQRASALQVLDEIRRAEAALTGEPTPEMATPLERERHARGIAEAAQRRVEFIYEATSTLFASPLDAMARLERLAALCVPDLADWCLVDIVSGPSTNRRVAVRQWNPERVDRARALEVSYPDDPAARFGIAAALRSGRPERSHDGERQEAVSPSEIAFNAMLDDIAVKSYLVVPLVAGARKIGALTFLFAESSRLYAEGDVALAQDLAVRAAFAVDNARLFEELKRAVQGRDDMVGIVSHDLRNPLASIQMSASMLSKSLPEGPDRSKIALILRATERMSILIRDLLDVTSLDAGKLHLEIKPTDVRAMMAEAAEAARPLAEARGLSLEFGVRTPEGFQIPCDQDRVLQILSNLIGNALKFTSRGGQIAVAVEGGVENLTFSVTDTGRGIAGEQLAHIFDRFWMGRQASREGTGLGLSIVKGIVEAHGGTLSVESVVGRGTTFRFELPTSSPGGKAATS